MATIIMNVVLLDSIAMPCHVYVYLLHELIAFQLKLYHPQHIFFHDDPLH